MLLKRFYKIIFIVLIAVLVISISVIGCKAEVKETAGEVEEAVEEAAEEVEEAVGEVAEGAEGEKVPIEIWYWSYEGFYGAIIEDGVKRCMEEHPEIEVVVKYQPFADYKPALKAALTGGEAPDLMQVWPETIVDFVNAEVMSPLNPYIEEGILPEFKEQAVDPFTFDGDLYVVPFNVQTNQIAYNMDMFEEYGLERPETAEELLAISDVLAQNGKFGISVGMKEPFPGKFLWWSHTAYTDPTHTLLIKADNGEISWDQPELKEAVQRVIDYLDAGVFAPGSTSMVPFTDAMHLFIEKQAGMFFPVGSNNSKQVMVEAEEAGFDVRAFPFPPKESDGVRPTGHALFGLNFAIAAESENKTEAATVLSYFYDEAAAQLMYENQFIPSYSYDYDGTIDPIFQDFIDNYENSVLEYVLDPDYAAAMLNGWQAVMGGDMTADEFIASMVNAK